MKRATDEGLNISNEIMDEVISKFEVKGDLHQIKIQIHPIISNAMFHRDNELLEEERFRTFQKLSREFNDEDMKRIIKSLGYHLTVD